MIFVTFSHKLNSKGAATIGLVERELTVVAGNVFPISLPLELKVIFYSFNSEGYICSSSC